MDKKKRPRINKQEKMAGAVPPPEDVLAYLPNKASVNARQIIAFNESITLDLWHDKHYIVRNVEREGIDTEVVQKLIVNAIKHLLFYSSRVKGFTFLNHDTSPLDRTVNIVLQDSYSESIMLNVVIEAHFVNFKKYEITVKTAMRINGFNLFEGQYAIEFLDKDSSVLKRLDTHNIVHIYSCQD